MRTIHTLKNCPIYVDDNIYENNFMLDKLKDQYENYVLITDKHVANYYLTVIIDYFKKAGIKLLPIIIEPGEQSKCRQIKADIEDRLLTLKCSRNTCLMALGGGVVTDLSGFVAATYLRGIDIYYLPTSLMAMVDASIGGKTGINTAQGKNQLGTFTHPKAIFISLHHLTTLPHREYQYAFSEIIKLALIQSPKLFAQLQQNPYNDKNSVHRLIYDSVQLKCDIVANDEKENGLRTLLNFGHTIGHALEQASDFILSHGAAVGWGIFVESYLSYKIGVLSEHDFKQIKQLLQHYQLLEPITPTIDQQEIEKALMYDKKNRQQKTRFVLLAAIGKASVKNNQYTHSVPDDLVKSLLNLEQLACSPLSKHLNN